MTDSEEGRPITNEERGRQILQAMQQLQPSRPRRSWTTLYWLLVLLLLAAVLIAVAGVGRRFRQYWREIVTPETTDPPLSGH